MNYIINNLNYFNYEYMNLYCIIMLNWIGYVIFVSKSNSKENDVQIFLNYISMTILKSVIYFCKQHVVNV